MNHSLRANAVRTLEIGPLGEDDGGILRTESGAPSDVGLRPAFNPQDRQGFIGPDAVDGGYREPQLVGQRRGREGVAAVPARARPRAARRPGRRRGGRARARRHGPGVGRALRRRRRARIQELLFLWLDPEGRGRGSAEGRRARVAGWSGSNLTEWGPLSDGWIVLDHTKGEAEVEDMLAELITILTA